MYAVVETGGKQYRVTPGDKFRVEKLDAELGATVELDRVLLVADGEQVTVGAPLVANAKVVCTVLEQDRAKKIIAFRYKPKKNVRVKRGHRQYFTNLRVERIEA
ncbi:MAG TPA: 50S ribosomal protein L21 [Armatimonadota bacterium]|nr:50S ribosomal protein L21 [Armatimonadota bacterium]